MLSLVKKLEGRGDLFLLATGGASNFLMRSLANIVTPKVVTSCNSLVFVKTAFCKDEWTREFNIPFEQDKAEMIGRKDANEMRHTYDTGLNFNISC